MLCMGVQASIIPEAFSWLNRCAVFARRGEPISPISFSWVAKISHTHMGGSGVYYHLPELQRSKAQSEGCIQFTYSWSCAEGAASEESRKESCVIEPAIEGSIGIGSITQQSVSMCLSWQLKRCPGYPAHRKISTRTLSGSYIVWLGHCLAQTLSGLPPLPVKKIFNSDIVRFGHCPAWTLSGLPPGDF